MGLPKECDIDISIPPWEESVACCSQGNIKGVEGREGMKQLPPASFQGSDAHGFTQSYFSAKLASSSHLYTWRLGEVAKLVP